MALPFIATIVDSDATSVTNEYTIRVRFECDFPTGKTDPNSGLPLTVHLAQEQTFKTVAADLNTLKNTVKAAGQAWKAIEIARLATVRDKTVAALNIGDSFTFPN